MATADSGHTPEIPDAEAAASNEPWNVWTVPNLVSLLRLCGIPLFLWLVLVQEADLVAFVVLVLAGASDWVDGYLARRLDQRSRLGVLLTRLWTGSTFSRRWSGWRCATSLDGGSW